MSHRPQANTPPSSDTVARMPWCALRGALLGLLFGCVCGQVDAQPPGTRAVTRDTARAVAVVADTRGNPPARLVVVPRPCVTVPPRTGARRVFEAVLVEPWVRASRIGVRMSASF